MSSDSVDRLNAALAGRYRLEGELGVGGMATVYLADDVRHDRRVALKVLKPELATFIGADRFLAEIKTTANLQHPHILPLFDSGEADGFLFYVMPYVEGDSLRERLDRERLLPVDEAVDIAAKVATALDYAHRQGIVHRDVKPSNILLHDGEPVVADFGIALAATSEGERLTETGLSLGTPEYMSPEQGSGERAIGSGSDIYALGCVLYEMLTGRPPHTGTSAQAIVAKIMTQRPTPVEVERDTVPAHVSRAVTKALQRLPPDRHASAGQLALALRPGGDLALATTDGAPRTGRSDWRNVALVLLGIALTGALIPWATGAPDLPSGTATGSGIVRFPVVLPDDRRLRATDATPFTLSSDGSFLVYVGADSASGTAGHRLYVRRMDRIEPVAIRGTEGASRPFVSPDGMWVGFLVGSELRRVPLAGGAPITLDETGFTLAGRPTWLDDGTIVYPSAIGRLEQVDGAGGTPRTVLNDSTVGVLSVSALPDSRGILFLQCPLTDCPENAAVVALALPDGNRKAVLDDAMTLDPLAPSVPLYAPSGHVVFGRVDGTVMAARFDLDRLELTGSPVPVLQGVRNPGAVTLAANGTFAYLAGGAGGGRRLLLLDRNGSATPVPGPPRVYAFPRFDPEGTRLAVEIHDESGGHLWLTDLASGTVSRITDKGHTNRGVWAPDGTRVAYASAREDGVGLFIAPVDRREPERELHPIAGAGVVGTTAWSWSPDGRWILFQRRDNDGSQDIFVVAADGGEPPRPLLATSAAEGSPRFSPDGRWIVYSSTESGRSEIYATAFPEPTGRWVISTRGGSHPVWRGDEIFYRGRDGLYAATVDMGESVRVVERRRLFDDTAYRGLGATFDVSPDGQSFVMADAAEQRAERVVVLNWLDELERLTAGPDRRP